MSSFVICLPEEDRDDSLRELLAIDFELRLANAQQIPLAEYLKEWPDDTVLIKDVYAEVVRANESHESPASHESGSSEPVRLE